MPPLRFPRTSTRTLLLFAAGVLPLLLTGCDSRQWFDDRMHDANSLSPISIASILVGGNFVNEELTCVSAGVLVSKGSISFLLAALACSLGVWVSDSFLYLLGMLGRYGLLDRAPLRWIVKREQLERTGHLFAGHGAKLVVFSRFMPGSRVPIYVTAGLLRYPYGKFAAWMALAALIWAPVVVWIAMKLGDALLGWLERYELLTWLAAPVTILIAWGATKGIEAILRRSTGTLDGEPAEDDKPEPPAS